MPLLGQIGFKKEIKLSNYKAHVKLHEQVSFNMKDIFLLKPLCSLLPHA